MSSNTIPSTNRQGPWLGLLRIGLGAGVLIGVAWWLLHLPSSAGAAPASQAPRHEASSTTRGQSPALPAAPSLPTPGASPDVLSAAQWVQLQQALASHPDREREQARVLAFLRFQTVLDTWRATPPSDHTRRTAWARQILDQLPVHLRNNELLPAEAEALLSELAADLADQAGDTGAWLTAQQARWQTAESPADQAERMRTGQQDEAFTRQANAITTQWLATPLAQRDQAALEQALQTLRERVYAP